MKTNVKAKAHLNENNNTASGTKAAPPIGVIFRILKLLFKE